MENLKRNSDNIMYYGGSPVPVGTTGKLPDYVRYKNILNYYFKICFTTPLKITSLPTFTICITSKYFRSS